MRGQKRGLFLAVFILSASLLVLQQLEMNTNMKMVPLNQKYSDVKRMDDAFNVFIMNAYLITDEMVRMTMLTLCESFPALRIYAGEHISMPVQHELLQSCDDRWVIVRSCAYSGRYGNVRIPKRIVEEILAGNTTLQIGYADVKHNLVPLQLIDSRISEDRKATHKLAVCVGPLVQVTDWTQLVRFMEAWIAHGATKFFIILQSSSEEFDAMLRIYENDVHIDVERVHWGLLPIATNTTPQDDPNGQIYLGEVCRSRGGLTENANACFPSHSTFRSMEQSINDCLLRARGQARYVASTDLDEMFVIRANSTLLETVNELVVASPDAGAVIFRSSYGTFPMILLPEKIKVAVAHVVNKMEDSKSSSIVVDPEVGQIYHLR
ncbi:unnamed protein product [Toxocara canis]|uniref:Glycosyltransferase family 92 protein n=1 Tax=Toxocara canis TaxID=6265 RepID=A0A183V455_TOXCA|nr:unnamed protein product [Toxocara canis]